MEAHKFDPARAELLDAPERERFLPDATIIDALELAGDETVVDYGAGTGRLTLAAAAHLRDGRVIALDESPEMIARLRERVAAAPEDLRARVQVLQIVANTVPLDDRSAQRILAVNVLHELRGERALEEMRRLLSADGFLLVIDWDRERPGEPGPPLEHRYDRPSAIAELQRGGFSVQELELALPYHFALRARTPA
jgi:ubiquinone/menaquinone biosynthesis C-methylase UbiE